MRAAGSALIATLAIAAAVLTSEVASPSVVRLVSAMSLVLFLPGLALTRALFPTRSLQVADMLLLSIALSVSLTVVGGVVVHLSPFSLTRGSWVALLAGVTLAAAGIGEARAGSHEPGFLSRTSPPRPDRRWLVHGTLLGLALGVAVVAMSIARTPLSARGVTGYTALWLLPADQGERYVEVGVQSSELETTRYRLEVRVGRDRVLTYRFLLATGAGWHASLRVERGWSGAVRARLYRATAPTSVYRRVRLLVDA